MPLIPTKLFERPIDSVRFQTAAAISIDETHLYAFTIGGNLMRFSLPQLNGAVTLLTGVSTTVKAMHFCNAHPTRLLIATTTAILVYDTTAGTLSTLISSATWAAATGDLPSLANGLDVMADGNDTVWTTTLATSSAKNWRINPQSGAISALPRPSNHFVGGLARDAAGRLLIASSNMPRSLVYRVSLENEEHEILVGTANSGSNIAGPAFTTASLANPVRIFAALSGRCYIVTPGTGATVYVENGMVDTIPGMSEPSAYLKGANAFVRVGNFFVEYWTVA